MRRQNLRRVAWVIFGAVLLGSLAIAVCGLRDDLAPADVGLVLGSKVERDGQPSRGLRARLDRAVDCYRAGCFPQIVVSGGVGKEGYDEAAAMDAYLIAAGVPADRIFSDSQGNTTYASAKNLHHLAQEHRWQTVMVITQYFHVPRARLALRHFGFRYRLVQPMPLFRMARLLLTSAGMRRDALLRSQRLCKGVKWVFPKKRSKK